MRTFPLSLALLAAALLVPVSMQAKTPWVKKSQELGFKDITNCQACHTAKMPGLNHLGDWLVAEKGKRKADQIDLAWMKDYKKP